MKSATAIILGTLALAGCQQAGGARIVTANVETTSTKSQRLNFFTSLNPDCTSRGRTEVRVVTPPMNGSIKIAYESDFPRYSAVSQRYECNRRRVTGTSVVYTPRRDFQGQETIVVEGFYPTGQLDRVTHTVNVR
jgi:hypothetical protein